MIFLKNVIIVFLGSSLVNFINLLYQLLIAHKLTAVEFASFNSLLSVFMLISAPLGTIQVAVTKYCSEYNAQNLTIKVNFLLSDLLKKTAFLAGLTIFVFFILSGHIIAALKIESALSGYILALLIASSWILPVFSGGIQGLELFGWLSFGSVATGALKLLSAFMLTLLGYNIAGALGALLIANFSGLVIFYFPLKRFFLKKTKNEFFDYRQMIKYLFPVAISNLCFIALVSFDMVLVKYFFASADSGLYSLSQMLGKIFLFLPGAVSMVMFPRTSGLKAKNKDTVSTLNKSLLIVFVLCITAICGYNLFPSHVLKLLTGKVYPESIHLGRLFSISMSFFTLSYILISYFLSVKDLRFIKFLALFTLLQLFAIVLFHKNLIQIQLILCINGALLFITHLSLAYMQKNK